MSDDGGTPTAVDSGDGGKKDPNPPASSCTAAPFVNFTATVSSIDLSETTQPLVGAIVAFSTCSGFDLMTNGAGTAETQISQGIPVTPIYEHGITVIGALGAEIPATGDVAPNVTLFASDVAPDIPGFVQDGGNAATIVIVLQGDPSATTPCNSPTGATLSVTGHPEAVVSYAGTGWPSNETFTSTSSTGPYVFINGITGAPKVAVTGAKSGCSVKLIAQWQTGNFVLLPGSVTIGVATVTN